MITLFLQAGPPHELSAAPGAPVVLRLLAIIPLILLVAGMALGFSALRDIRLAGGALGGAMTATFAAGLLPALIIVIGCAAGLTLLGEALSPASRSRSEIWLAPGTGLGVWLSFLMMRAMHRGATGWTPPVTSAPAQRELSRTATAAIVLTIAGAALTLVVLVVPPDRLFQVFTSRNDVLLLDLGVLLAGLICGVLSRREAAGKTCAWISGALFVLLLLTIT